MSKTFDLTLSEGLDPLLRAGLALLPAVQRAVLEVAQGFVRAHREGGADGGVGVAVEQRREGVDGTQDPAEDVVDDGQQPQDEHGDADPPEVEGGEELHVERLVAFVRRVVVAVEGLAAQRVRAISQSSGCQEVHPRHVAWKQMPAERENCSTTWALERTTCPGLETSRTCRVSLLRVSDRIKAAPSHCNMQQQQQQRNQLFVFKHPKRFNV